MSKPLVSICIPVWNRPEMLRQAMLSAMGQTYEPLEIVVCDNASTDSTAEVARSLAAADSRVHVYVNDSNVGGFNYTMTLRASRGELVKFVNSDDLLDPHCVQRLAEPLQNPRVALSFCRARHIDRDGRLVPALRQDDLLGLAEDKYFDGRTLGDHMMAVNANLIGLPTQVLWRRSALGEGGMAFGDRGWQVLGDLAHWMALLANGDAFYVDEALCSLRYHEHQEREAPGVRVRIAFDCLELAAVAARHGFLRDRVDRCSASTIALRQLAWRFDPEMVEARAILQAIRVATERLRMHGGGPPGVLPAHGMTTFVFVERGTGIHALEVTKRWLTASTGRDDMRLILAASPETLSNIQAMLLPLRLEPRTPFSFDRVQLLPVTGVVEIPGPTVLLDAGATVDEIAAAASRRLVPDGEILWGTPAPRGLHEADKVRIMRAVAHHMGFDLQTELGEKLIEEESCPEDPVLGEPSPVDAGSPALLHGG